MTHKQLWKEIAKAFGTLAHERTPKQVRLTKDGLCYAACSLLKEHNKCVTTKMDFAWARLFIFPIHRPQGDCQWFPMRGDHDFEKHTYDNLRSIFASQMAAMTKKEFEDLCGHKYSEFTNVIKR